MPTPPLHPCPLLGCHFTVPTSSISRSAIRGQLFSKDQIIGAGLGCITWQLETVQERDPEVLSLLSWSSVSRWNAVWSPTLSSSQPCR